MLHTTDGKKTLTSRPVARRPTSLLSASSFSLVFDERSFPSSSRCSSAIYTRAPRCITRQSRTPPRGLTRPRTSDDDECITIASRSIARISMTMIPATSLSRASSPSPAPARHRRTVDSHFPEARPSRAVPVTHARRDLTLGIIIVIHSTPRCVCVCYIGTFKVAACATRAIRGRRRRASVLTDALERCR